MDGRMDGDRGEEEWKEMMRRGKVKNEGEEVKG